MRKSVRAGGEAAPEGGTDQEADFATGSLVESADAQSPNAFDFEEMGEHVASVLRAAELAAQGIRTQAEQDAEARVNDAGRQAGNIMHEVEVLRGEAEETARVTREQAEAYAERTRRDADLQVSNALRAAEETAAARAREVDLRQKALRDDVERTEKRLAELGTGLRELAARLDELVGVDKASDDEVDRRSHRAGDSLEESLMTSIGAERTTDEKT